MRIIGGPALRRRLKAAFRDIFKPLAVQWTDKTVQYAKQTVRVRTGRTQQSIRRRSIGMRRASVKAGGAAVYLSRGYPPHEIAARNKSALKFTVAGTVRFAKRVMHPRARGDQFLKLAAKRALRELPVLDTIVKQWNGAG